MEGAFPFLGIDSPHIHPYNVENKADVERRIPINPSGTVILCVHGIQGSPSQFDWILSALNEQLNSDEN